MNYPAIFTADSDGGFVVTFRDIPEAITQAESTEEAVARAIDAFETAVDFYFDAREPLPGPSRTRTGEVPITIPPMLASKIALWNRMHEVGMRKTTLAKELHVTLVQVDRLFNSRHQTRLETIVNAAKVLGKRVEVTLVDDEPVRLPKARSARRRAPRQPQRSAVHA